MDPNMIGKPWGYYEEGLLKSLIIKGNSVTEIAKELKRTKLAIHIRVGRLIISKDSRWRIL